MLAHIQYGQVTEVYPYTKESAKPYFTAEFIAQCVETDDENAVAGAVYDAKAGTFTDPSKAPEPEKHIE